MNPIVSIGDIPFEYIYFKLYQTFFFRKNVTLLVDDCIIVFIVLGFARAFLNNSITFIEMCAFILIQYIISTVKSSAMIK